MDIRVRTQTGTFAVIPPAGITLGRILDNYVRRIKTGDVCSMTITPPKNGKGEERVKLLREHNMDALASKIDRHLENGKTVVLTLR